MTSCLMIGAALLSLPTPEFTLRWTHSVEKVAWVETYQITPPTLRLTRVAIKGSGAGMEPADDATLDQGWWVWRPDQTIPELHLAASGSTGAGWTLCTDSACQVLGQSPANPITLKACPEK